MGILLTTSLLKMTMNNILSKWIYVTFPWSVHYVTDKIKSPVKVSFQPNLFKSYFFIKFRMQYSVEADYAFVGKVGIKQGKKQIGWPWTKWL